MRIRSIKPEFWRDEGIVNLPVSARLTFIGLWSYVDDNGVGDARVSSVVGDLYSDDMSRDPQETLRRVSGDLRELSDAGMIVLYTDPENARRELLYVVNWTKHQLISRPSKGHEYPLPLRETLEARERLRRHSGDTPETPLPGTGEQGNRGTGEQGSSAPKGAGRKPPAAQLAIVEAEIVEPATPATTQTLIGEWIDHRRSITGSNPVESVKGQLAKQIGILLKEGQPYEDVRRGVALWDQKGLHPAALGSVVEEARTPRKQPTKQGGVDWTAAYARAAARDRGEL